MSDLQLLLPQLRLKHLAHFYGASLNAEGVEGVGGPADRLFTMLPDAFMAVTGCNWGHLFAFHFNSIRLNFFRNPQRTYCWKKCL